MTATINGRPVQCADSGVWDRRMISRSLPSRICSYYPDIGRGNIEHSIVSHRDTDSRLSRCSKKSLVERLAGWLDV